MSIDNNTKTCIEYVFKPLGVTSLNALNRRYTKNNKNPNSTYSFAGRLDELACGLLPLVTNDKNKEISNSIHKYNKEYYVTLLVCGTFGKIRTDTGDIMGKFVTDYFPEHQGIDHTGQFDIDLNEYIQRTKEITAQTYPIYSSKTTRSTKYIERFNRTKKIPLWKLAKLDCLPDYDDLPKRDIIVHDLEVKSIETIAPSELYNKIETRVKLPEGDFRQDDVLQEWLEYTNTTNDTIYTARLRIVVSTGTYIRGLCHSIGGVAMDITRTKVGTVSIDDVSEAERFVYYEL